MDGIKITGAILLIQVITMIRAIAVFMAIKIVRIWGFSVTTVKTVVMAVRVIIARISGL
jgi:hypothetical protein